MSLMFADTSPKSQSVERLIDETLASVRELLGMEVAFVSEFREGRRVFRFIDAGAEFCPISVDGGDPLEESYCQRVIDGRLPELIPDATKNAEALTLAATLALPVGAHLSVPIRFSSGRIYGTFCCFSRSPDLSLGNRDLAVMKLFAGFVAKVLEDRDAAEQARRAVTRRLREVLQEQQFETVFQPIFDIARPRIVGFEALARFHPEPYRPPNEWIDDAVSVGLQKEVEHAILHKALERLQHLPDDVFLSLNVTPTTLLEGSIGTLLAQHPLHRLVLEITEHESVSDYGRIAVELEPLRAQGMRVAVDDAGAGYASFRHILNLQPEIIKLDGSLIQNIDSGLASRALAAAVVRFAEETGSQVIAEGVETEAELSTLRELKVGNAQGFLLGRPLPADQYSLFSGMQPGRRAS